MQDVPNIVRKQLQAAVPDSAHPDANLLTSFAEKSLPERERANVFEHLARCADCREILAFSMPEESVAQPVVKPSPTRWLTWPVLRWGVVAAGIVLVSSVGLIQYRRSQAPELFAKRTEAQETLAAPRQKVALAPTLPPASAETRADVQEPKAATTGRGKEASPTDKVTMKPGLALPAPQRPVFQPETTIHGFVAGNTVGGPVKKQEWQQQAYQAQMPVAPAAPMVRQQSSAGATTAYAPKASTPTTVEVSGEAPLLDTKAQPAPNELSVAPQSNDEATARLSKAKPAPLETAEAAQITIGLDAATINEVPILRWTISASGTLQRSFDKGATWQDVNVTAGEATSAPVARAFANVAPAGKAVVVKQNTAGPTFRAVAANGPEIWAGGLNGALYHSSNTGTRWVRVVPSTAAATLTGDILKVEFSDAQHGAVTTSTGEVWSTSDTGQTWQKQ